MSEDREQRNLEVVKLRIAFLQHIATLSGAATLIILAIMQRTEDPFVVSGLALIIVMAYAFTALFSVLAIGFLLRTLERTDIPLHAGRFATTLAAAAFAAGTVFVVILATSASVVAVIIVGGFFAVATVIMYFRRASKPLSNEPEADREDPDATPRPERGGDAKK